MKVGLDRTISYIGGPNIQSNPLNKQSELYNGDLSELDKHTNDNDVSTEDFLSNVDNSSNQTTKYSGENSEVPLSSKTVVSKSMSQEVLTKNLSSRKLSCLEEQELVLAGNFHTLPSTSKIKTSFPKHLSGNKSLSKSPDIQEVVYYSNVEPLDWESEVCMYAQNGGHLSRHVSNPEIIMVEYGQEEII